MFFNKKVNESQKFIILSIQTVMSKNIFKQPDGVYTSRFGFAMGCRTSAICTDILLLVRELRFFKELVLIALKENVRRFHRYRDDVNFKISGSPEEMKLILQTLIKHYPKSIPFNIKVTFLRNTFLDIEFFTIPQEKHLSITVLRKAHSKHDIVRSWSATNPQYIGSSLRTSAYTAVRNTNHKFWFRHQTVINNLIATKRGYSKREGTLALKAAIDRTTKRYKLQNRPRKLYVGKITFNKTTKVHHFLTRLLKSCKYPKRFSLPLAVGSKKVREYACDNKKTFKKLEDFYKNR